MAVLHESTYFRLHTVQILCCGVSITNAGQSVLCRLQTRAYARTTPGKKQAIFYGTWDVSLSLMVAFFVNAAILITAAGQTANSQSLHPVWVADSTHLWLHVLS